MPDVRPILAIAAIGCFLGADSFLQDDVLGRYLPESMVPIATSAIIWRWHALLVLATVGVLCAVLSWVNVRRS